MIDIYVNLLKRNNSVFNGMQSNSLDMMAESGETFRVSSEENVIKYLFEIFVTLNEKMLLITDGYIHRISSKNAFMTMAEMQLKREFLDINLVEISDKGKKKWLIDIDAIYDTISSTNSFKLLRYKTDLFAENQKVLRDYATETITVVSNKLHIKELSPLNVTREQEQEIIADYKNHFPQFDILLKLIVDMRFAKNRKASFLHLRVKSNWGKSFLSGILKNLEIGFEIDYHNLMNTGASSISPIQVRNSFVLLLDEFNNFSQEMKKLSQEFTFAPKFGQSETIELYLKILMSAEKSPSFVGGVDEQILNRVMVFDIADKEAKTLTSREIYNKHGNGLYMAVLEDYANRIIREKISNYLNMEKFEAHREADNQVLIALDRFQMKAESLSDNTKDILNNALNEIIESGDMDMQLNPKYRELKKYIREIRNGRYEGKVFIKSPQKVFETILKVEASENEYKKMRYKLSNLDDVINLVADHRGSATRISSRKSEKGIVIDIEEPKTAKEVLEDLKENGNLIIEEPTLNKSGNLIDAEGNEIF